MTSDFAVSSHSTDVKAQAMNQEPDGNFDSNPDSNFVPRAPRFEVTKSSEATVTITRTDESERSSLTVQLIDVSQHGVKLRVPVSLSFEETLQLNIEVDGTELEYQGIASVRHIRSGNDENGGGEHWTVGCAIAPPLTDEAFAHLATTAGKERRQFRRLPIAAEATVRRQAETESTAITLHNLSSGGVCFSSDVQYEIGERVQLTLNGNDGEPRVIETRICWQVDGPDGNLAGCQFSSRSSYAELCACLTEQPALEVRTLPLGEVTSKLVLAAAVLAMFVPPMMTLMLQANKVSAKPNADPPIVELASVIEQQPPQFREWLDNTGKHRTLAELIEVTPKHLVLLKKNGRHSKVPWRRLSEEDQAFARAWKSP